MFNFREFDAGPDPFDRKYHVLFKWLQTAISIRHADTVDVKFVLTDDGGSRTEKTIALPHADLLRISRELARDLDDPWCARIAAAHVMHLIETGEDMEKDLITILPGDLKRTASEILGKEKSELAVR